MSKDGYLDLAEAELRPKGSSSPPAVIYAVGEVVWLSISLPASLWPIHETSSHGTELEDNGHDKHFPGTIMQIVSFTVFAELVTVWFCRRC